MKIYRYVGGDPVLVMTKGKVWEVHPQDTVELDIDPGQPTFQVVEVKAKKGVGLDGREAN